MGAYNVKFKIGDTVFWLSKQIAGWSRSSELCPECQKYGAYENIYHDVFINSERRKCIHGRLYVPYFRYSVATYKVCAVSIRRNKKGEDIVYYVDETGVNHLATNTFATKSAALSALRLIYKN